MMRHAIPGHGPPGRQPVGTLGERRGPGRHPLAVSYVSASPFAPVPNAAPDRLLYRWLGCGGRLPGHNGALADMPSLGRAHGLLHGAAAGILFGQLLGAAAGSLILLLIQPARCTAGIQLTRFAHYISSLLCGVFYSRCAFAYS